MAQLPALPSRAAAATAADQIGQAVLSFVSRVPGSEQRLETAPMARRQAAQDLTLKACAKAAATAGGLALPPGPLGWLTLIPELMTVWRVQAQLVADIATLYGKQATLTREQMMLCLFKHMASQALRDVAVRTGERWLVRTLTAQAAQSIAKAIGLKVAERTLGKSVARWVPVLGAVGVGAYAYYDTQQVAKTAIALFEGELQD